MKYILWIILTFLTTSLFAQGLNQKMAAKFKRTKVKDSISLENGGKVYLYQEKSDKIRFMGQLCIATAEMAAGDIFKWGLGGSADVFFNKYISLHAEYTKDYMDVEKTLSRNDNQTNNSINDVNSFGSMEAGIRIFLKDQHTRKKHAIILESHRFGRTTVNYYIKPMLPCRRMLALRAGYIGNNTVVNTDMASGGTVLSKDGTVLGKTYFTNSFNRGGYLGIANIVLFSAVTKNSFKKGSVYLSKAVNELYFDVLFAKTTFDPIVDTNGTHPIVANDPGSFQTLQLGARVGYKRSKGNRGIGSTKIELGSRPGVKGNNLYLNIGFSIALIK